MLGLILSLKEFLNLPFPFPCGAKEILNSSQAIESMDWIIALENVINSYTYILLHLLPEPTIISL